MTTATAPLKRPEVDAEIRHLLPPLSEDEQQKLETKLQLEGCLKPLIVWREENILLDGHHSLTIYEKHEIPFTVEYMRFPTREMAIEWVIDNQLGRRNLTDERRAYYRGKKYRNHKQSHGAQERFSGSPSAHSEHLGATAENIGPDEGVSPATVRRDAAFAAGVDQLSRPAKEKVLNGEADAPRNQVATGVFCDRCTRTGPARDCPQCAELRAKVKRKQEAAARKQKPRDNPHAHLPKSVQNALADTWHADSARILSEMRKACKGVFSWSSWLDAAVVDHLRAAEECLLAAVPKKVCPECEGHKTIEKKQCNRCRGGGYLAAQV